MAIDDNATYGLTGAQIKELPGKIEAVKGLAKVLTTEDYNYPANNPTKVALWLLKPGNYIWAESVQVVGDNSGWTLNAYGFHGALVGGKADNGRVWQLWWGSSNNQITQAQVDQSGYRTSIAHLLQRENIINNLTSTNTERPLAANQGKVLKDLVDSLAIRGAGAPTANTVGQVGTLYEDTTNGDLYICADATDPYVWEEVGAGGGGGRITKLTTEDYNYHKTGDVDDGIAIWLLEPGVYYSDGNVVWYLHSTADYNSGSRTIVVVAKDSSRTNYMFIGGGNREMFTWELNNSDGTMSNSRINMINSGMVKQSTGTSTTDVMSQKAVTDAITAIGVGTRKATSTGWNTSKSLDYILQASDAPSSAQGAMFYTGTNLSDFPVYAGIGVKANETAAKYTPYLLIQTTSDDGQGITTGSPIAYQIALHSEIPATFTTNEWDALWA